MFTEVIVEEGIVISSSNGYAEVRLKKNDNCNECSAITFCKPIEKNSQLLKVIDPFNTKPGDLIKISIYGKTLLKTSFLFYGISLIIFIGIILLLNYLFPESNYIELFSSLAGFLTVYFYFHTIKKLRSINIHPKIIFVENNRTKS